MLESRLRGADGSSKDAEGTELGWDKPYLVEAEDVINRVSSHYWFGHCLQTDIDMW